MIAQPARSGFRIRSLALVSTLILSILGATQAATPAMAAFPNGRILTDDFTRPTSPRWGGVAGVQYQTFGSVSVANNRARTIVGGGSAGGGTLALRARDVQVQSQVWVPLLTPRTEVFYSVDVRSQADRRAYRASVVIHADGTTRVTLSRGVAGRDTALTTKLGPRVGSGQAYTLAITVSGTTKVSLGAKFVKASTAASGWQLTKADTTASRIVTAGSVTLRGGSGAASPSTSLWFDHLLVSSVRPSALVPTPAPTPAPATRTYVAASFDGLAVGGVRADAFSRTLRNAPNWAPSYKDMSIISRGSGKAVRTVLKAGTIHSKPSGTSNGAVFSPALPQAVDRACLSYDIKFSAGFDFSLGGKLPGLQGSAPGYSAPTGGHPSTTGWSGRMMWVGPKAYRWAGPSNMAVSYLYHPGQKSVYGDNVRWNLGFTSGGWHTVKQCYVMNTVGRANGVLRAWMDGRLVVNNTAFVYRTRADVHISSISWAVFRGGATLDWASPRDGSVDIDSVRVTSY